MAIAADKIAGATVVRGQDAIWTAIRTLAKAATAITAGTIAETMAAARRPRLIAHKKTIEDYVTRLAAGGVLVASGDGYALHADPGPRTPRIQKNGAPVWMGAGRRAIWRTMRILGQFTVDDIVKFGTTEEVAISRVDAAWYARTLAKAGYLIVAERPRDTRIPTTYRMVPSRSSGPLPPQVQRNDQIYDPNLGRVTWREDAQCL